MQAVDYGSKRRGFIHTHEEDAVSEEFDGEEMMDFEEYDFEEDVDPEESMLDIEGPLAEEEALWAPDEMAASTIPGLDSTDDALTELFAAEAEETASEAEAQALMGAAAAKALAKAPKKVKKVAPTLVKLQLDPPVNSVLPVGKVYLPRLEKVLGLS